MKIIRGKTKPHGLRIVIYGPAGVGKTHLGAKLEDHLFLDYEDGTHGISVTKADNADLPVTFASVIGVFKEFQRDHQGFKHIVIDTADKLENKLDETYSKEKGISSVFAVNDYGRTVSDFTKEFATLLDRGTDLVNSGMDIIVLAHEQVRKKEVLEGTQSYDHSELKLSKGNTKHLMAWADVVIFVNYKTTFVAADKKTGSKAHAEGGKRWCFTAYCNDWEAKHRACIELPDDCSLDRMCEILPKAIEEAVDRNVDLKKHDEECEARDRANAEDEAKGALAKKREATSANKPDQPTAAKPSKETKKEPEKEAQPKNDSVADLPPAAQQFVKLLKQYDLAEEDMRKYAAGKLNDRYGVDLTTLPLAEWPEEALNWLNRGFDKIAPQIKK